MRAPSIGSVLSGLRLVTLAPNLPGPLAAERLRDMGMQVTKVESPSGDPMAQYSLEWYATLHRGIDVVRLDLKTAEGRGALEALLGPADLLLTSHRLAALERLGLEWTALHARHPQLCHVAIIGEAPPRDGAAGHDLTYQAIAGLVDPDAMPMTLIADLGGALDATNAALGLLLHRLRTNEARQQLVALADAALYFALPVRFGLTGSRERLLGGACDVYGVYQAAEGWVAVAALEPHFRDRLLQAFPGPGSPRDRLTAGFVTQPATHWHAWAEREDLPLVALRSR